VVKKGSGRVAAPNREEERFASKDKKKNGQNPMAIRPQSGGKKKSGAIDVPLSGEGKSRLWQAGRKGKRSRGSRGKSASRKNPAAGKPEEQSPTACSSKTETRKVHVCHPTGHQGKKEIGLKGQMKKAVRAHG